MPEIALGIKFEKILSISEGFPLWFNSGNRVGFEISGKKFNDCIVLRKNWVGSSFVCSNKSIFQSPMRKTLFLVMRGSFRKLLILFVKDLTFFLAGRAIKATDNGIFLV